MRKTLWIAADLGREALATPAFRVMAPLLALVWPVYHGALDGWIRADANPMRLWLSGSAIMPAVLATAVFAEFVLPRILTGEMEPLLAAPVTDREIAVAHMLPVAALQAVYLAGGIPLTMLTYRLVSGTFPEQVWLETLYLALGSTGACVLVAAAMGRALTSCRSVASLALWMVPPVTAMALVDIACWLLRLSGRFAASIPLLAVILAAGAAAAWRTTSTIRRDRLLSRG